VDKKKPSVWESSPVLTCRALRLIIKKGAESNREGGTWLAGRHGIFNLCKEECRRAAGGCWGVEDTGGGSKEMPH